MTEVLVRRLTAQDVIAYRAIRLHGLWHEPIAFTGCHDEEIHMEIEEFCRRIGQATDLTALFGAFAASGALIGVVGLEVPRAAKLRHKALLWGMYTLPTARGLGVGRLLMTHLLHYARQHAIERILLVVTASNPIRLWYEQIGFKVYGVEQRAVKFGNGYEADELRALDLM